MTTRSAASKDARTRPGIRPHVDLDVVIPAYNEEGRLPETLDALEHHLALLPISSAVVVVDNGSVDGTVEIVRSRTHRTVPVSILGCSRQGKGAAVRRGVLASRSRYVGFCDADLATSLTALTVAVAALQAGDPVVIGSRRVPDAQLVVRHGPARRMGSYGFRRLVRGLVPNVADTQCGFKFFDGDVGRSLFAQTRSDGFAFDVELLARAERAGYPITEVPVHWQAQEGSTFHVVQDGRRAARELLRIRRLLQASHGEVVTPFPLADLPYARTLGQYAGDARATDLQLERAL